MKKGQLRSGRVETVKFPNKAEVLLDPLMEGESQDGQREICIVKGALPGQRVSLTVTRVRKGKGEGRLKEILEKSPLETATAENGEGCQHFGICGGCVYLSMPYEEGLKPLACIKKGASMTL